MSIESAVRVHLLANAPLAALVGTRIFPLKRDSTAPLNQLPAITYQRISTVRYHAMGQDADLATVRLQFDCWGSTWGSVSSVAAALVAALRNACGTIGNGTNTATKVAVLTQDEIDSYDDDTGIYRRTVDFSISHEE